MSPVIRQAYPLLYSRVAQQKEQQLAKLKAAGAIPAVGTIGHEEERNPPRLGRGDTRGSTEMPDHFYSEVESK